MVVVNLIIQVGAACLLRLFKHRLQVAERNPPSLGEMLQSPAGPSKVPLEIWIVRLGLSLKERVDLDPGGNLEECELRARVPSPIPQFLNQPQGIPPTLVGHRGVVVGRVG